MAAFMALLEQEERKERRPRIFRDRNNPIDYMADVELIERYRMPRIKILEVVDLIRKDIESPTSRSHAIPAILQVLVSLRYYAKGDFYSEVGDLHGISKASVSRCITRVSKAIVSEMDNIKFPSTEAEMNVAKGDFIVLPRSQIFTNLVAKFPGSVHDSYIFSNSELGYFFEENNVDEWLLGDSGYGLKKCLHKTGGCLPFTPDKSAIVVTAVFKLHNKCIDDKLPLPDFTDDFIDNGDNHIRDIAPANVQTLREHIIQRFA
ncbi:HARBI1 [Mytilus edulis]|uniref:HARBI1 n=1 Tax=Mytilus edulis TaxID=6550 RepID=A0A8S3QDS6_MYTED|nr:HARBI1 [Mytilus edulis]